MGEKCRTGCVEKTHSSYAECLRAGAPRIAYANSAAGWDASTQRRWDAELDAYRDARAEGIQPAGTRMKDIEAARRISDATGTAYQADA